jgi:hypothetical protein
MTIKDKPEFVNEVISRVINNAPISEVLRVYSLSVKAAIDELDDDGFFQSVLNAGYTDLIEKYADLDDLDEFVEGFSGSEGSVVYENTGRSEVQSALDELNLDVGLCLDECPPS